LAEFGWFGKGGRLTRAGQALLIMEEDLFVRLRAAFGFLLEPVVELAGESAAEVRFRKTAVLIAEEGPVRAASRRTLDILPEGGPAETCRLGEGLQELFTQADGTVFLGTGLRLLPTQEAMPVSTVGMKFRLPTAAVIQTAGGTPLPPGICRFSEAGNHVVVRKGQGFLGISWAGDLPEWCDRLGGEGLWARIDNRDAAPFFHSWESHLRQWPGPHGWQGREGARLLRGQKQLIFAWHSGSDLPVEQALHFSGVLALTWADSEDEVRRRLEALAAPLAPSADGAAVVGFDHLEGSYRFRRTGKKCAVTFPADPLGRTALVRVDGAPAAALACSTDGAAARPQLVSVGRTDDPYGPNDGRPDGGGRPVLAARERPAERVELAVKLSPAKATRLELAEAEGLSLSYLSQDDRRELLLWSTRDASAPLGRLSLHDLRLRDLRPPGLARPAAACLPLYWYLMNAPSPWHSANLLESWELIENGPGAVRLRLAAANPDRAVRSTFDAAISLSATGALLFDIAARLEVAGRFPVPHFQFLNLFPESTRMPDEWTHDETLAASAGFLRAVDNREGSKALSKVAFAPPFFLAQYATGRRGPAGAGNLAVLVTECRPAGTPCAYELCRCWLDDHFYVAFPGGAPAEGSKYEVRFQTAFWPDRGEGRAGIEALARRALDARRLEV
jgi:hypothetical protein